MSFALYVPNWTIDDVLVARPTTVFYALRTGWWTHSRNHLYKKSPDGIPIDPINSPLLEVPFSQWYQTDKIAEAYEGGIRTLMAGHHGNLWTLTPNLVYLPTSLDDSGNTSRHEKAIALVDEWDKFTPESQAKLLYQTSEQAGRFWPNWPTFPAPDFQPRRVKWRFA
jgi:hypothetical protein